jgi:cellulose synthase/poly-beta-1,6-N-acetylglucosamine synthase-like glycosyltransferase
MFEFLDLLLLLLTSLLSIPLFVFSIQIFAAIFQKSVKNSLHGNDDNFVILMPAHNESQIIADTLNTLLRSGVPKENVIVVADNCSDNTADIIRGLDVKALERTNHSEKGKGFALAYGLDYINQHCNKDVVVILDADCEITYESLKLIAAKSHAIQKPVQALYLMELPANPSIKQQIATFAWQVKNQVRPMAMQTFGLPVTLTGTGMAFPLTQLNQVELANGNIVEDMQLGIDLTLLGHPPEYCGEALVTSQFAECTDAEKTQRTRWEHGHIHTILHEVPKLLVSALRNKSFKLFALALDLSIPPLSLLVLISSVTWSVLLALYLLSENGQLSVFLLSLMLSLFLLAVLGAWYKFGRDYLQFSQLLKIPFYIFTKLSVYISFLFSKQKAWVKTSRDAKRND